jgi:hypothetical protein
MYASLDLPSRGTCIQFKRTCAWIFFKENQLLFDSKVDSKHMVEHWGLNIFVVSWNIICVSNDYCINILDNFLKTT